MIKQFKKEALWASFFIILKSSIILILIFYFMGCGNKNQIKNTVLLKSDEIITFDVGYTAHFKFSGRYLHKLDSTEYIYFADPVTQKKLKIFSVDGELKWEIPLDSAVKELLNIEGLTIVALDTIICANHQTNSVCIINSQGLCWKNIDFTPYLESAGLNDYELYPSAYSEFVMGSNNLLFGTTVIFNFDELPDSLSYFEKYAILLKSLNTRFHLIKVENIYDSMRIIKGYDNFYPQTSELYIYSELINYSIFDNKIFDYSIYNNKIYVVNQNSLEKINEIEIESEYSNIGCNPIEFNEDALQSFSENNSKNIKTCGAIISIYYDYVDNNYLVVVMHEVPINSTAELVGANRPWSILIYDSNFIKLDELYFEAKQYIPNIIIVDEGILIYKYTPDMKNYDKKMVTFELYERQN